jgi:hypothetical protein
LEPLWDGRLKKKSTLLAERHGVKPNRVEN